LSSLDSRWIFENKNLWKTSFSHDTSAPFAPVLDDQVTEILANDIQEVEQIVEENWLGGGDMIIQSEHLQPRTVLQEVYENIPDVMKEAFGHFSSAYGAIEQRYRGKHIVFTAKYVFL
jgi:adenine-specific DNA methylase